MIRKMILDMDEQKKYEVIKGLLDHPRVKKACVSCLHETQAFALYTFEL